MNDQEPERIPEGVGNVHDKPPRIDSPPIKVKETNPAFDNVTCLTEKGWGTLSDWIKFNHIRARGSTAAKMVVIAQIPIKQYHAWLLAKEDGLSTENIKGVAYWERGWTGCRLGYGSINTATITEAARTVGIVPFPQHGVLGASDD